MWRGRRNRKSLERFKSVYSIFVSRIDVYTEKHLPDLSPAAQGQVGIVNAKRLWRENQEYWKDKKLPLQQEIIFASTGTKKSDDPPDKYVSAMAGSDIQTNPPATNEAVQKMANKTFTRMVDQLPPQGGAGRDRSQGRFQEAGNDPDGRGDARSSPIRTRSSWPSSRKSGSAPAPTGR